MTTEVELVVDAVGGVRCIYDEDLDLWQIGRLSITRASHVEPDAGGCWWADMGPVAGQVRGPCRSRSEALRAERGAVLRPRYPTVRRNCFRYFAGVMPVRPLKMCVKWLCEEKPRSRATCTSGSDWSLRVSNDA